MKDNKKLKIIFLDFDGVINGNNPIKYIIWKIFKFFKIEKDYNIYGIHENKVKLLSKLCKDTGAEVVLTSSWREIL